MKESSEKAAIVSVLMLFLGILLALIWRYIFNG